MANPVQTKTGSNGAAQSIAITPTSTPTVGNYLVVALFGFGNSEPATPTFVDTGSNTYTVDENETTTANLATGIVTIAHTKVASAAGAPFKVTVDLNDNGGANDAINVVVYEITGDSMTQPDNTGSLNNAASGASISPGSVTPITAGDFTVVAFAQDAIGSTSWTSPTGYTSSLKVLSGVGNEIGEILYKDLSGTPATNPSFSSISPNNMPLAVAQAFYRPVAGSGARGLFRTGLSVAGIGSGGSFFGNPIGRAPGPVREAPRRRRRRKFVELGVGACTPIL
ncbi:MAG: hypothetical protein ACRESF_01940 [Pseudomonas sp.]